MIETIEALKKQVWQGLEPMTGFHPDLFRKDFFGDLIRYTNSSDARGQFEWCLQAYDSDQKRISLEEADETSTFKAVHLKNLNLIRPFPSGKKPPSLG